MALSFNSSLAAALAATSTKLAWADTLRTALGDTRRLVCSKDGTVFLNVGMTGPLVITSGNVTGFGVATGYSVRMAADLTTGACLLRIEGNGNWMQGTLGLSRAAQIAAGVPEAQVVPYDFSMPANPNMSSGIGFSSSSRIKAPKLLASGTGPAAPAIRSVTPTVIELEDWTNPAAPVVVGSATFSVRTEDWVFEHPEMAAEMGDIAIYELASTIKWTSAKFELGGLLFLGNNANTLDGTTPLEQMLLWFKPIGRWASYPAADTFKRALWTPNGTDAQGNAIFTCTNAAEADTTYPPPFKIKLRTAGGSVVHTHEMKAFNQYPTLPINSPEFMQAQLVTFPPNSPPKAWQNGDVPAVPHFNCGMALPWENIRTRLSSRYRRYFPGVSARSYGPRVARDSYTSNASNAFDDPYTQRNGLNHMYAMPPYPMKANHNNGDSAEETQYDPLPRDPYTMNTASSNASYGKPHRFSGWKYQPGSVSGHDWYMGKGGQRFDRSPTPSLLAIYVSDQSYVRPHGAVPIRDMLDGFAFAYFNHSCFMVRDARTGATVPKEEMYTGGWTQLNAFYGAYTNPPGLPAGADKKIDMCGIKSGSYRQAQHNDASGRMPWGGYLRDALHSHAYPGIHAMVLNSPMHAFANVFFYNMHWMCSLGDAKPDANPTGFFLMRQMAWRWLAYTAQWIVGTAHPRGITHQEVESRFQIELEKIYDFAYVPAFVNNEQTIFAAGLRRLGVYVAVEGGSMGSAGGSMGLYCAHTLALMKQTGLWAKMKARSVKCRLALEMVLEAFDKQVIDYILDTKGRDAYYQKLSGKKPEGHVFTVADVPTSWAAQSAMLDTEWPVLPANMGSGEAQTYSTQERMANWNTSYAGVKGESGSTQHLQYQWATVRKFYFPEYPHARLDAALAKFEQYYAENAALADAGTKNEWAMRFPSHGDLLAPSVVGPN